MQIITAPLSEAESNARAALQAQDWAALHRWRDRLREMLIRAVAASDNDMVAGVGAVIDRLNRRHRIGSAVQLSDGPEGVAWSLQADAGVATIAARALPCAPEIKDIEEFRSVSKAIASALRGINRPLTNSEICQRTGKSPSVVSKVLKRMVADRQIEQWKDGIWRYNRLANIETTAAVPSKKMNREKIEEYVIIYDDIMDIDAEFSGKNEFLHSNKKRGIISLNNNFNYGEIDKHVKRHASNIQ